MLVTYNTDDWKKYDVPDPETDVEVSDDGETATISYETVEQKFINIEGESYEVTGMTDDEIMDLVGDINAGRV